MLLHKILLRPVQAAQVMASVQWVQYALSHQYWSQGHVFFITLLTNKQAETECYSFRAVLQARWRHECWDVKEQPA